MICPKCNSKKIKPLPLGDPETGLKTHQCMKCGKQFEGDKKMKPTHLFKVTEIDDYADIGITIKIMIRIPEKAKMFQKQKLRDWFRNSMHKIEKKVHDFMGSGWKLPNEIKPGEII